MERPQPDKMEVLRHLFDLRVHEQAVHTETGERLSVEDERFEEVEVAGITGIYEHYKSTPAEPKLYYAGRVKRDSQNDEHLVVYMPLYEDGPTLYARPLDMFLGSVEQDGRSVERFRRL